MSISGTCRPEAGKCSENFLLLYWIVSMGRYIGLFKSKSYPTSIDEGTTIVITGDMNFIILRVVPSTIPEIRYDG